MMKKSVVWIVLVAVLVSGVAIGFLAPEKAEARKEEATIVCQEFYAYPCWFRCCYSEIHADCWAVWCPW